MDGKNIKIAIKNMNAYLDECHDEGDVVTEKGEIHNAECSEVCDIQKNNCSLQGL